MLTVEFLPSSCCKTQLHNVPDISECITEETSGSNGSGQEHVSHLCCLWQSARGGEGGWSVVTRKETDRHFALATSRTSLLLQEGKKKEKSVKPRRRLPMLQRVNLQRCTFLVMVKFNLASQSWVGGILQQTQIHGLYKHVFFFFIINAITFRLNSYFQFVLLAWPSGDLQLTLCLFELPNRRVVLPCPPTYFRLLSNKIWLLSTNTTRHRHITKSASWLHTNERLCRVHKGTLSALGHTQTTR